MVSIFFSQKMNLCSKNNDLFSNGPEHFKTFNFKKPKVPDPQAARVQKKNRVHSYCDKVHSLHPNLSL